MEVFYREAARGQAKAGGYNQMEVVTDIAWENGVVGSQILIRDPFKNRNETRIMMNPVLGIRGHRSYVKKYSGPIN